jgi:hypothetical protein
MSEFSGDQILDRRIATRVCAAAAETGASKSLTDILSLAIISKGSGRGMSKGEIAALARELILAANEPNAK